MNTPIYRNLLAYAHARALGFFAMPVGKSFQAMAATAFREAVEAEEEAAQDAVPLLHEGFQYLEKWSATAAGRMIARWVGPQ